MKIKKIKNVVLINLIAVAIGLSVGCFKFAGNIVYAGDAGVACDSGNFDGVEKFRHYLKRNFLLGHDREIDFTKREEANKLYNLMKDFLNKTQNIPAEHFEKAMVDYIKNNRKNNEPNLVLPREQFEKLLSDKSSANSKWLRLFNGSHLYKKSLIKTFKEGGVVTDIQKILKNDLKNYTSDCLRAVNRKEVADLYISWSGPWLLWSGREVAVDLNKVSVVEESYLDNLIAIIKYDHPQEFGFMDEIMHYTDENVMKKRICDKFSPAEQEGMFYTDYFLAPMHVFNSADQYLDEFYKQKIGCSYFDYLFKCGEELKKEIEKRIEPFQPEIDKYYESINLITLNDEDFDSPAKNYVTNKNYALIKNYNMLAKLLGYDIFMQRFNVEKGELSTLGIKSIPDDGNYIIVDYGCFVTCDEVRIIERNEEFSIVSDRVEEAK